MGGMFAECNEITELDVSGFDTGNVANMAFMFGGCINVAELPLISNSSKFEQFINMLSILFTLLVSNPLRSKDVRLVQPENIASIVVTVGLTPVMWRTWHLCLEDA